jgi:hypothetical protein
MDMSFFVKIKYGNVGKIGIIVMGKRDNNGFFKRII